MWSGWELSPLGMQVFTSDHALKLEWIPEWVAIIGSGYIGLEFADVYTALGSEVTLIEVCPQSDGPHRLCHADRGCCPLLCNAAQSICRPWTP